MSLRDMPWQGTIAAQVQTMNPEGRIRGVGTRRNHVTCSGAAGLLSLLLLHCDLQAPSFLAWIVAYR